MAKKITTEMDVLDMDVVGVPKELTAAFVKALKNNQDAPEWLRATMSEDVKRYFNAATPVEQLMVKGAYNRTRYILKLLQSTPAEVKEKKTLRGGRHV